MKNFKIVISSLFLTLLLSNNIAQSQINANESNLIKLTKIDSETFGGYPRFLINGQTIPLKSHLRQVPAGIFTIFTMTGLYAIHTQISTVWWHSNEKTHFFFGNDWNTSLQADKLGHFYATYIWSAYFSEGLMFSGLEKNNSAVFGASMGFIYQMYIETLDGFFAPWGFSTTDAIADLAGSGFYLLHNYIPESQYIIPKWNTFSPRWLGSKDWIYRKTWFDLYNTSSYWFSVDIYHYFPENVKKYWLPWLNISAGYAVRGFDTGILSRKYLLSLDYNLLALFPESHGSVRWLLYSLNFVKFPSPAIEIGDKLKFYLLFPFEIKL